MYAWLTVTSTVSSIVLVLSPLISSIETGVMPYPIASRFVELFLTSWALSTAASLGVSLYFAPATLFWITMPVLPTVITSPNPIKTSLLRNEINVSSVTLTVSEPMVCVTLSGIVSFTVTWHVWTPFLSVLAVFTDVDEILVDEVVTRFVLFEVNTYVEPESISSSKSVLFMLELYAIFILSLLNEAPVTDSAIEPTVLLLLLNTSCIDTEVLPAFVATITPSDPPFATADTELVIIYEALGFTPSR